MRQLEFFFDFMSTFSYLAAMRVEDVAARSSAQVRWRPCYLPGILKATGNRAPIEIPAKAMYALQDATRWAAHLKLPPFVLPEPFPFNSAQANRVALVLERSGALPPFAKAMYRRLFAEGADGASVEVIGGVLASLGHNVADVLAAANGDDVRAQLKENTEEAVRRGAFGLPTFFVGEDMFVGNDRLDFVERALTSQ